MLSLIRIRNYAVIDELELELQPGLSVMTGETGAGKSILVDALGLALGDRADASTVRHGATRAEISVMFDCPPNHPALEWLTEHGLDEEQSCVIRRTVSAEGRSRAFINGQPATLQDLRMLGARLVEIHGQHAHQSLLQSARQREILDFHGDHDALVKLVAERFTAWQKHTHELEHRCQSDEDRGSELELLRFRASELQALALTQGEVAELRAEHGRLANVDRLANGLNESLNQLYEADAASAYSLVVGAKSTLESLAALDDTLAPTVEPLQAAEIELREVASELSRYRDRLESDPGRLQWIDARLTKIAELARRYDVNESSLETLLPMLSARIEDLENATESLEALQQRVDNDADAYFEAAEKLSESRSKSAATLSSHVSSQLKELGLPHGEFRIECERKPNDRADINGVDRIEFQITLNPGQPFGPLDRMASGGELSRISLALEVVGTGLSAVPTLVFDEVDTGIGGGVAEIVGRRLGEIGTERQVLCVTHLPQVASQGRHHYRVVKLTDGRVSRTNVRPLSGEERVEELSRMLGGVEITERARAHAAEMIDRAAE